MARPGSLLEGSIDQTCPVVCTFENILLPRRSLAETDSGTSSCSCFLRSQYKLEREIDNPSQVVDDADNAKPRAQPLSTLALFRIAHLVLSLRSLASSSRQISLAAGQAGGDCWGTSCLAEDQSATASQRFMSVYASTSFASDISTRTVIRELPRSPLLYPS